MTGICRPEKLWSIKLDTNKAFLYKGGKKVDGVLHIVSANTKNVVIRSQHRNYVELEFVCDKERDVQFITANPDHYNKFASDGDFRKIDTKDAKELVKCIKNALTKLEEQEVVNQPERRIEPQGKRSSVSPLYSNKAKRKKNESSDTNQYVKKIEDRCNECRLDDTTHFISIEKIFIPPKERKIREVDEVFLASLVKNLKDQPAGNYEPLFVLLKGVTRKDQFKLDQIDTYEYEVLGGTHLTLATKKLHQDFPTNRNYFGRDARIYVGLKDEEALWLGAMHNNTGAFRHSLTYKDEVEICRTQLFLAAPENLEEPPKPSDGWRDMCSSLLNKPKRNLSEIFTMAQISQVSWGHFLAVSNQYEKGDLKDQKVKSSDVLKGRTFLKQWQFKELCSLDDDDRAILLEKVANLEMSLDEMKQAGKEIKIVKPVQLAIVDFFKLKTWEEATTKFGNAVTVEKLLRYAGKAFETSHPFQKFLTNLKKIASSSAASSVQPQYELFEGQLKTQGIIIPITSFDDVQQEAASKLPNYEGAFLVIGNVSTDKESARDIVKAVSRLNFTKQTSFNVVLFSNIKDINSIESILEEEGSFKTQTGHFFMKSKRGSTSCKGSILQDNLVTFIIGHWSVSRQLTDQHISCVSGNVIEIHGERELSLEAYGWLISHLSKEGDTVIDLDSCNAYTFVSALNSGRNSIFMTSQDISLEDIAKLLKSEDSNDN